jgi:DNA-nicking Smr family endonuclease
MSGERSADAVGRRPRAQRRLTADDEHVWSAVVRTVKSFRHAVHGPARHVAPTPAADAAAVRPAPPPVKKKTTVAPPPRPASHGIERRERELVVRGRAAIDARLDLHGMTQAEAHVALLHFLRRSQAHGAKFVLVITGKGAPGAAPDARGVLRRQVPLWLALPDLHACVLGFDAAHAIHGGDGALYVRLRKAR